MVPAYRAAETQRGPGMFDRQKRIISRKIEGDPLFDNILDALNASKDALLKATENRLQEHVDKLVGKIVTSLQSALAVRSRPELVVNSDEARKKTESMEALQQRLSSLKKRHEDIIAALVL